MIGRDPLPADWFPHGRSERELSNIPELYDVYVPETRPLPDGRYLTFLRRRDTEIAPDPLDP